MSVAVYVILGWLVLAGASLVVMAAAGRAAKIHDEVQERRLLTRYMRIGRRRVQRRRLDRRRDAARSTTFYAGNERRRGDRRRRDRRVDPEWLDQLVSSAS